MVGVSPRRTTVSEELEKGKPDWTGTARKVEGVVVTWNGTVKEMVEASAEEAKVCVAEAPGKVLPSNARLIVRVAGIDAPGSVETELWKEAW